MRPLLGILAFAIVVAACGEDPLSGVGDLANQVVHDGTTTTFIASPPTGIAAVGIPISTRSADELTWLNIDRVPVSADPRDVLIEVWERGRGVTSGFVQAGPDEITLVLPELIFPGSVPLDVLHVSSQLVFDSSGILDPRTSAAFGLWNTVPYSVGRAAGQVAVLTVGQTINVDVADDAITSEVVADGIALTWQHVGLTYEIFCRDTLPEAACWEMATSGRPLRTVDL